MNKHTTDKGNQKTTSVTGTNVLGESLEPCSYNPLTGYFRDGCCNTDDHDVGRHLVCGIVTQEFLEFSRTLGNDLISARPEYGFDGLKAGDRWCLCVNRWFEAYQAGCAPKVVLEATNQEVLTHISSDILTALAEQGSLKTI